MPQSWPITRYVHFSNTTIIFALIFVLFFISIFSSAYATQFIGFDQTSYFYDHQFKIIVTDTTISSPTITATISPPQGINTPSCTITLGLIDSKNHIYQSSFIKFVDPTISCSDVTMPLTQPTSSSITIRASYGATDPATATITPQNIGTLPGLPPSPLMSRYNQT